MIFAGFVAQIKDRLAKRAEFRRLVDDINSLTSGDLTDMRANRTEMIHRAYLHVYGDDAS